MDAIGDAIGEAIGRFADDPVTGLVIRLIGAYVVLVWLAAALWAFVDTRRRSPNLIAAYASAAIVVLASPLLFPFAIIVHRALRPAEYLSDVRLSELRSRALEAEALTERCPDCRRPVDETWLICPACRRQLGHRCRSCGGTVALDWPICAWCGADLDGSPHGDGRRDRRRTSRVDRQVSARV